MIFNVYEDTILLLCGIYGVYLLIKEIRISKVSKGMEKKPELLSLKIKSLKGAAMKIEIEKISLSILSQPTRKNLSCSPTLK